MSSASNLKNEEAEAGDSVPFFTSLRRLARQLDNGIKETQERLERGHSQRVDTHHIATKLLLDYRKEMQTLKKNARESLADMRRKNSDFEATVQLCSEVVDLQLDQLSAIQEYLEQYGYVAPQKKCTDTTSDSAEDDQKDEQSEEGTQKAEKDRKMLMSPRLEDFGISSYTLNLMNRPAQRQADFKVPSAVPGHNGCKKRLDSVPTPFQNKGLTVTPSLFSTHFRSEAGKNDMTSMSLACSPLSTVLKTPSEQDKAASAPEPASPQQPGLAKTLDFVDSPVPPVLHTPGIKQIPRMKDVMAESQTVKEGKDPLASPVPPVFMTPGMKQIPTKEEQAKEQAKSRAAKQLKLGDDPVSLDSPVPPILQTPGIKQIPRGSVKTEPAGKGDVAAFAGRFYPDELEVPKTPELTYSLKDLEEMTMSFRNTSLTNTFSEKTGSWNSDPNSKMPPTSEYSTKPQYAHTKPSSSEGYQYQKYSAGSEHTESVRYYSSAAECAESIKHYSQGSECTDSKRNLSGDGHQNDDVKTMSGPSNARSTHTFDTIRTYSSQSLPPEPPLPTLHTNRYGFMSSDISGIIEMPQTPELQTTRIGDSFMSSSYRHGTSYSQSGTSQFLKKENAVVSEAYFDGSARGSAHGSSRLGRSDVSGYGFHAADHRSRFHGSGSTIESVKMPKSTAAYGCTFSTASHGAKTLSAPKSATVYSHSFSTGSHSFKPYVKEEPTEKFGQTFSTESTGMYGQNFNEGPTEKYGPDLTLSYNKENMQTPPMPELRSQKFSGAQVNEPGELRLTKPLTDSNLDLPPTPKFMGSYHFMSSRK